MKPDPLIEEIWKTKDDLARQARYDVHRFFNELRRWSAEHPGGIPLVSAEDLRRLAQSAEFHQSQHADLVLKDEQKKSDTSAE